MSVSLPNHTHIPRFPMRIEVHTPQPRNSGEEWRALTRSSLPPFPSSLLQNNKLYCTRHPKGGRGGNGVYCAPHEKHITSITSLNPPSCLCSVTLGSAGRGATSDSGRSRGLGLGSRGRLPQKGDEGGECDGAYPVFFGCYPTGCKTRQDRQACASSPE